LENAETHRAPRQRLKCIQSGEQAAERIAEVLRQGTTATSPATDIRVPTAIC
jgi:hypothetical protein